MNKKEIKDLYRLADFYYDENIKRNDSDNYRDINNNLTQTLDRSFKNLLKINSILSNKNNLLASEKADCFLNSFNKELNLIENIIKYDNNCLIASIVDLKSSFNRTLKELLNEKKYSTKNIFEELYSLKEEYKDKFKYSLKNKTFSVITEEISLKDRNNCIHCLGDFEIIIDFRGSQSIEIAAKNPNESKPNPEIVHPHVSDGYLCEGEAAEAIGFCFFEGRFSDLIVIITNILNTYNPMSPYVKLEEWNNQYTCSDCGYSISEDDVMLCDHCQDELCSDCYIFCDNCEKPLCSSHISYCYECKKNTCHDCLVSCSVCGYDFCENCLENCKECSNYICNDCSRRCEECGDNNYCNDCLSRCEVCHGRFCNDCLKKCKECGDYCCVNCLEKCEECDDCYCDNCKNAFLKECKKCKKEYCENCLEECKGCGDCFCDDCLNKCKFGCHDKYCEFCMEKEYCPSCLEERNNIEEQLERISP